MKIGVKRLKVILFKYGFLVNWYWRGRKYGLGRAL